LEALPVLETSAQSRFLRRELETTASFPVLKKVQVHLPFHFLHAQYLPKVLKYGINPEISFNSHTLDTFREADYRRVAERLHEAGRRITFHAPFMDLRPGAIDPRIREASRERIGQVLALAALFRPEAVVCHPSFDSRYYVSTEDQWLENSLITWRELLAEAATIPVRLVLENVYEEEPRPLQRLLAALDSPDCGFCFDTGHYRAFSRDSLAAWLECLHPFLRHVHLHDNNGEADAHLPVGDGDFPFKEFFTFLRTKDIRPIFTIEAHNERNLRRSLENMERLGFLGEEDRC